MAEKILIKFKGHDKLSSSAISHYVQQTDINYVKLMIIQKICTLIKDGLDPDQLVVASKSADLFNTTQTAYNDYDDFFILAKKGESAKDFWNVINRHYRPVVFYKQNNEYIPIFNYQDEDRLIIRNLSVNSPVNMSFEGAGSALADLYYAPEREQRNRIQWQNEQIGQVVSNINEIGKASSTINDPAVPEGVKRYAENILNQVMQRQEKLNAEIGLTDGRFQILG
ncbi:MAG: hypothetical protein PHQ90_04320 [Sulfuricurvum sp.]|uniref:hypothetical protein n=1 Tax=Sulfuricurvum sp. TaxID=2025608 RepID=UPI002636748E|nr:hypothetical protein [Sulfuricurvum sp.]MDD2368505.1 hypothetical protein [Sulfuricurvum sp.]MDD2949527.1 hypothetical protein [Sulfuricurvum sp.]MDD5118156.1 hypothetical protein [Sulfuricurvum sp.]